MPRGSDGAGAPERSATLPFFFETNVGQGHPAARYVARAAGYTVYFGSTDVLFELTKATPSNTPTDPPTAPLAGGPADVSLVRMSFEGARPEADVVGEEELPGKVNYLIGPESQWRTNIPAFKRVVYRGLYPGIDMACYEGTGLFKYDFVVSPGADPGLIRLAFEGLRRLSINPEGDLVVETDAGPIQQRKPLVYQEVSGERRPVEGAYVIEGRRVRFRIGPYDSRLPLVIDPVVYSSFFGAAGSDYISDVRLDPEGNIYLRGVSDSRTGIFARPTFGNVTFVAKLDPTARTLLYMTLLSTSASDFAVDRFGSAYLTGGTTGGLPGAPPGSFAGLVDAYVMKLTPDGAGFVYSRYLGGSELDQANGLKVDADGNVYVVGGTRSKDWPITGAVFQPVPGGTGFDEDAWVAKLDPNGQILLFSYLGGNAGEGASGVALDRDRNLYVTGLTYSTAATFPPRTVANSPQPDHTDGGESSDVFIVKISSDFTSLVYLTFIGGRGEPGHAIPHDVPNGIAVDGTGGVYVGGFTLSMSLPLGRFPPFQPQHGPLTGSDYDGFLARVSPDGTAYDFVTFLGGSSDEFVQDVAVDSEGVAYVTGYTRSPDFPKTQDADQAGHGGPVDSSGFYGSDATFARFKPDGTAYVSFLGGSREDGGVGVTVAETVIDGNPERIVYVVGATASTVLVPGPVPRPPFQASYNGGLFGDGFIVGFKFKAPALEILPPCPSSAPVAAIAAASPGEDFCSQFFTTRWKPQRDMTTPIEAVFVGPSDLQDATLHITDPNDVEVAVTPMPLLERLRNELPFVYRLVWNGPWTTPAGKLLPAGNYKLFVSGTTSSQSVVISEVYEEVSLVEVKKVEFAQCGSIPNVTCQDGGAILATNTGAGAGKAVFPDAAAPGGDYRRTVLVRAEIEPNLGPTAEQVTVYFRFFDVDDPSANAPPIDDDTVAATSTDNKNETALLAPAVGAPTASGAAVTYFKLSTQQGNNYRLAASTYEPWLGTLCGAVTSTDGLVQYAPCNPGAPPAPLPHPDGDQVSEMLTVWRKLHLELSEFDPSPRTQTDLQFNGTWTKLRRRRLEDASAPFFSINIDGLLDHTTGNGWEGADVNPMSSAGQDFPVRRNNRRRLSTRSGNMCSVVPAGFCTNAPPDPADRSYYLRDDKLPNLTNTVHDVSLLETILASAYVGLEALPTSPLPWDRNLEPQELQQLQGTLPNSAPYWSVLFALAFDPEPAEDYDPTDDGSNVPNPPVVGRCDPMVRQPVSVAYLEAIADYTDTASATCIRPTVGISEFNRGTTAHEVLHALSLGHDGDTTGGIMCSAIKIFASQANRNAITEAQRARLRELVQPGVFRPGVDIQSCISVKCP